MRNAPVRNPIQGFTPTRIATASAATPFDTTGIIAIRVDVPSEYYINADSANKAMMPAGVTVIDRSVYEITFTSATVVEVMS